MSEYNVGDYHHRPGDRIVFDPFPAEPPRRRRDRPIFEGYNVTLHPDGRLLVDRAPWWVRRWRALCRWFRP